MLQMHTMHLQPVLSPGSQVHASDPVVHACSACHSFTYVHALGLCFGRCHLGMLQHSFSFLSQHIISSPDFIVHDSLLHILVQVACNFLLIDKV